MSCVARCVLASLVASALAIGCPDASLAQQKAGARFEASYKYDKPGVQLDGVLTERKVYGPPGYGETPAKDTRTTILVLKLARPISVEPPPNAEANGSANLDGAKNVREVQLFISHSLSLNSKELVGRSVAVTGTLNESITASQYTKVWLEVKTLSAQ